MTLDLVEQRKNSLVRLDVGLRTPIFSAPL